MKNDKLLDARLLTPFDINDERYKQRVTTTIASDTDSKKWQRDAQTPDVAAIIERLTSHREAKEKEGPGFVPGDMLPGRRLDSAVRELHAVVLDCDLDPHLEAIADAMVKSGKLCLCYTTFTHLKTTTEIKRDNLTKFAPGEDHDAALARRYLTEKKNWPTRLTETVEVEPGLQHTTEGIMIVVRHKPIAKCRIVFPLKTPFVAADCPTLNAAKGEWRKIVFATAELLGLAAEIDKSGADFNRFFYYPRHAPGAEHDTMLCGGDLLDWRELDLEDKWAVEAEKVAGRSKSRKSKTKEGQDLASWSKVFATRFQIAEVLRVYCDDRIRGEGSLGVEIECPNDAAHSSAGDPDDRACQAINAGDGAAPVFSIKCQHASCGDLKNLDMLGKMLADEWFPREVITSDDYNALIVEDDTPSNDNRVFVSTDNAVSPAAASRSENVVADGYGGALAFAENKGQIPKGVSYDKETCQIHSTYRNALLLIGYEKWDLGYNELTQNYGLRGDSVYPWPDHLGYALNDAIRREIRLYMLRRWGVTFKIDDVYEATMTLARRNTFNPVCDYLDEVERQWDGTPRVERWLEIYMGVGVAECTCSTPKCECGSNAAYVRAVGRIDLTAAVRRAREPGCKFDEMLILEGPQGSLKSAAVRALGGEYFSDSNLGDLSKKDARMKMRGVWLQEIAELAGLTRAEVDELKEFMSQQVDRYRPPYGKSEEDFPRRFVFIGTVNPGGGAYLADLTGNRRFWPVACGKIDLEALVRDRDQLWAEAAMMESRGDSIRLDPSLYEAAKAEQSARLADDPWVEILADYLDGQLAKSKTRFTSVKLLSEALDLPSEKQTQTTMRKLKGAMALIPNWKYKPTLRADGLRTAGYEYAPPTK